MSRRAGGEHHHLRNKRLPILIGMVVASLAVWAGLRGWFKVYELKSYDMRMGLLNNIPASEQIVHIDIDDGSLAAVGRWPWPRERLAELIEALDEAGAGKIALDILLRQEGSAKGDARLAEAMAQAGMVLIPTHFRLAVEQQEQPAWAGELNKLLGENPFELDTEPLTAAVAAERLGVDRQEVAENFYSRRQEVVDDQALELLRRAEVSSLLELLSYYGRLDAGEGTGEYAVLGRAFRRAESILAGEKFAQVPEAALSPAVFSPGHIDPPIPELSRAAGGIAFIATKADGDGVYRRAALLGRRGKYVYKQYAFLLACDLLGVKDEGISYDPAGYLVLEKAGAGDREAETIRIPVDRQGRILINFRPAYKERWWQSGFEHIAAGKVLEIPRLREKIQNNSIKQQLALREAVRRTGSMEEFEQLGKSIAKLKSQLKEIASGAEAEVLKGQLSRAEKAWGRMREEAIDQIRFQYESLPAEVPSDPEYLAEYRNILLFYQDLVGTDYEAQDRKLRELLAKSLAVLREKVGDKICLVGSTASGGAGAALDYVSSPVFRNVPGVVVHGNILNSILQGKFLREVARWQGLLLVAACGILATVLSSLLKPFQSVGLVVAGMGGYLAINFAAFSAGVVLPLVLPLTTILLGWAGVMAYRQLFEAREKRRMATALGQFTSPAVARRILAQPDLLSLSGETRQLSCYFSDLKGFTPLSEKLGPEKTVSLLNRYLDKMTEVLFKHEATVNKFAGDGIFAFFGAPEPQADHARRACLAAVDSQEALARLGEELVAEGGSTLRMRVGINTGPAVVGNCGSSRKFDYTALGDTVNLASRLEPSNKFFGSEILVSRQTFEEADLADEILSRPLGAIVAVGRTEITEVVEILGPDSQNKQKIEAVRLFPEGLEAYRGGRLKEALEVFEACLGLWREDQPAKVYADLCREKLDDPGQGEWDATVWMTSK